MKGWVESAHQDSHLHVDVACLCVCVLYFFKRARKEELSAHDIEGAEKKVPI